MAVSYYIIVVEFLISSQLVTGSIKYYAAVAFIFLFYYSITIAFYKCGVCRISKIDEVGGVVIKTLVTIGGDHGVGKTSLCRRLELEHHAFYVRQRDMVTAAGQSRDLKSWAEIRPHYDLLLEEAAKLVICRFKKSGKDTIVVDCHYAISGDKSLDLSGRECSEKYTYNLDPIFVRYLLQEFDVRLVLLQADLTTVLKRINSRAQKTGYFDGSPEGLLEQKVMERVLMSRLARFLQIPQEDTLVVENSQGNFEGAVREVSQFLGSGLSARQN
jgi:cytidylate kinase